MYHPGPGWVQDPAERSHLLPGYVCCVWQSQAWPDILLFKSPSIHTVNLDDIKKNINPWSQEPDQQPEANPGCRSEATIRGPGGEFKQKTALQFTN